MDSSIYAEVKRCKRGVKEVENYRNVLNYLGLKQSAVEVNQDNKSGIRIVSSGELREE